METKKRIKKSIVLVSMLLAGIILLIILALIAAKLLDYAPKSFFMNVAHVFTFDFYHTNIISAAVLIYFVVLLALALWGLNLTILIINRAQLGESNMLLIAFIFSFFFVFPISLFFYTVVDLNFIKVQINNKQVASIKEIVIPDEAKFDHKNYLDKFSLEKELKKEKELAKERAKEKKTSATKEIALIKKSIKKK